MSDGRNREGVLICHVIYEEEVNISSWLQELFQL